MKELEKTRRISISAVLFLLVIIISLLTFKKPEYNFANSSERTLAFVNGHDHVMSMADFQKLDTDSYLLIDVRSNFDYSKGHIDHAVNIPKSQILDPEAIKIIKTAVSSDKPLLIYGKNPETANAACLLLFQLGYEQLKLLSIQSFYDNKQFHIASLEVEKPLFDYSETMKKARIQIVQKVAPKAKPQPAKKKVITKPKKKKKMPEGGC
jgi:rhodanese-related sulfurtransferase